MLLGFLEAGLFVTDAECETVLDLCSTTHTHTHTHTHTNTTVQSTNSYTSTNGYCKQ